MKKWPVDKTYEILVRHFKEGATLIVYTGPWAEAAVEVWENAKKEYFSRRVRRYVTEREMQAFMYGHPSMVELEKDVDGKRLERFYDEGDK